MSREFLERLNEKQVAQLNELTAGETKPQPASVHPAAYTKRFHESFGFPVNNQLVLNPSESDRLRRGRLILEETLETLTKGLGLEIRTSQGPVTYNTFASGLINGLSLAINQGHKYDPVETADGIADMNVVNNGTALELGIPIYDIDHEVFCSNMTKLDESGKPILNRCVNEMCEWDPSMSVCHEPSHLIDPTAPVGKGLKPAHYTKANVARVLWCHVQSKGVK